MLSKGAQFNKKRPHCDPLCIIGIPSGMAGQSAALNEDGDKPDLTT